MGENITVKATGLGYYDHRRRREGDVFTLKPYQTRDGKVVSAKQQFSKNWMEIVPDETPEKISVMTKVSPSNLEQHQTQNLPRHTNPDMHQTEETKSEDVGPDKSEEQTKEDSSSEGTSGEDNEEVI